MLAEISIQQFELILPKICSRETSQSPKKWGPENPLFAHCLPVSMLAHDIFAGKIFYCSIFERATKRKAGGHFYNVLPDGQEKDFTKAQFEGEPMDRENPKEIAKAVLMIDPEARELYTKLKEQFFNHPLIEKLELSSHYPNPQRVHVARTSSSW